MVLNKVPMRGTLQRREKHPDMCLALLKTKVNPFTGEGPVIAVKWGECGYHDTDYENNTQEWVDEMNSRLGLSSKEAQAMIICSMDTSNSRLAWKRYESTLQIISEKSA